MAAIDVARGFAWLVVAIYVLSLVLEIRRAPPQVIRTVWGLGAAALLVHILWTISVVHHGSLREAYIHTAEQTERLVGIRLGAGLYVNVAMLFIWAGDAVAWFMCLAWSRKRRAFLIPLHVFFSFLFFNATIVFGTNAARWLGIVAIAIIVGAWLMKPRQAPKSDNAID